MRNWKFFSAVEEDDNDASTGLSWSFDSHRAGLVTAGLLAAVLGAGALGAAGYLAFRDPMVAGLMDRETRLRYAYEDRLAALRLRLDQTASRQFINQDGVEGKLQSLVLRQAQLETRAAAVADLVERTTVADGVTAIARQTRTPDRRPAGVALRPATPGQPAATLPVPAFQARAAGEADAESFAAKPKPQPEGVDAYAAPEPQEAPRPRLRGEATSFHTSRAGNPDAPLASRLDHLTASLDRIERDQAQRLSGLVRPAQAAADRLRQVFSIAGVPTGRIAGKSKGGAVGGPYIPAPAGGVGGFERELAAAQSAVAALDELRQALPYAPVRMPLSGPIQMTSTFGYRTDPFLGRPALHSGVDLRDDYGQPVKATAAGAISAAGPSGGYGNMVEVDHGGGLATRYAHLSGIAVAPGQHVQPGEIVGYVGSTGRSTGPHLHYEVRLDGEAIDPARFLKAAMTLAGTPE